MPEINEFPNQATEMTVLDRFGFDQQDPITLQWLTKKYDLPTLMGALMELFPDVFKNIYTGNGIQTSERTVDMNELKLMFMNGRFLIGTTGIPTPGIVFRAEIAGDTSGTRITGGSGTGAEIHGAVAAIQLFSLAGLGVFSSAPRNVFRDNGTSIPSDVPSSLIEVMSTTRGVRVLPALSEGQRDAISTPADHLMLLNRTIGYPELHHPSYGWQSIGYGRIQITIDFSVTPYDGATPISIATSIPQGKLIHKIVAIGYSIDTSSATSLIVGMNSQPSYFTSSISTLNSSSGDVSVGNSNRTIINNEVLKISADDTVSSGILEITIYHT